MQAIQALKLSTFSTFKQRIGWRTVQTFLSTVQTFQASRALEDQNLALKSQR